jgi:gluconate 5-dehydrogenase
MDELFDLTGKVAIITGGAGAIGRTIAVAFAHRGASVVVTSRDQNKLEAVAEEIRSSGGNSLAIAANVTDEKSVTSMVDRVVREFARIDILVNAAGATIRKTAVDMTADDWRQIMELNAMGTFICCRAVGKVMIAQKGGKIINLSSIRGRFGTPFMAAAYGPSKGAVEALTRTLACEWGQYNIYINALAPSIIKTEFTRAFFEDPDRARNFASQYPLGRVAELDDIVGPAIFLASKASSFVNGQIVYVDGGSSAGFMYR